ncbi:hypothetical protein B0H15DRAFT_1022485 [Mycena belliarum]|uniref:Uncharacterized protein n=1 Tax=Mycena belliarum TaxID=1033014 RepID=A0AAD6XUJ1_9AGAR|nr:hypothetical protein B0H15DRAFT_1022485 [Mycena belliae]
MMRTASTHSSDALGSPPPPLVDPSRMTKRPQSLPEDIERTITELLLYDAKDMCGTMALVASRFNAWTKPVAFGTSVVRVHDNWTARLSEVLLPNARFIQRLAIMVPFERTDRSRLPDDEVAHIERLLEASTHVRHLAVLWSVWARLPQQCGSMHLKSLYLKWDWFCRVPPPSLNNLQYPGDLEDLTVYAPADHMNPASCPLLGTLYVPNVAHCTRLAYVTYAANTPTGMLVSFCEEPKIKGVMFVLVDIPEELLTEDKDDGMWRNDEKEWPNFSAVYLRYTYQVLAEWLAKMEGRPSALDHPPPHYVEGFYDDE